MAVAPGEGRTLRAEAELSDDVGNVVGTRSLSDRTTGRCEALAAAVGAWTQIALDEALTVASETSPPRAPPARAAAPVSSDPMPTLDTVGLAVEDPEVRPTPAVEGGALAALRSGGSRSGALVGFSPFATVALSDRWLLRPSLFFARARMDADARAGIATYAFGGRVDVCGRIPGNYVRRRGIEFDMCMGSDVIHHWSEVGYATRATLGPAATLRGELGWDIGLELRGTAGVALNRASLVGEGEIPLLATSIEFGVSMRIR